jgi:hypothetical protein
MRDGGIAADLARTVLSCVAGSDADPNVTAA